MRQALSNPDRCGAMIIGASGTGKTTVMNRALEHVETEVAVYRFRGSELMRDRELGILEVLLSQAGASRTLGAGAALSTIGRTVARSSQGPTPIVRVDNANLVDSTSLSVLCQLAEARRIRLLIDAESIHAPVDLMANLWLADKITRVDLDGLDEGAITALVASTGESLRSSAELRADTGGNPRLLNYVLFSQDQIRSQERILFNIPASIRSALQIIAIAGAVPYHCLNRLCNEDEIDSLFDVGVLTTTKGPDAAVKIAEPVIAGTLRSQVMPAHGLQLFRRLSEVVDIDGLTGQSLFGYLRWGSELGLELAPDRVLESLIWANANGEYEDAAGLGRASANASDELLLEIARSEKGRGNVEAARALFERLLAEAGADGKHSVYLSRLASMDMRLADPRAPDGLRTLWVRDRLDAAHDLGRFDVTRAWFELKGGRFSTSRHWAARVYHDHTCQARHRLRACALLGMIEVSMGRVETGVQYSDQAELMFGLPGMTSYEREDATVLVFVARYASGDWAQARESMQWADRGKRMRDFAGALVDIRTGHHERAQSTLDAILSQTHESDSVDITRVGSAAKRYADALVGKKTGTDEATRTRLPDIRVDTYSWWTEFEVQLFDLQTLALTRRDSAAAKLCSLGDVCREAGAVTMAASALIEAARLGHPKAIEELASVAQDIDGGFGRLAAAIATGMRSGRAPELLEAAREALAFDAVLMCSDLARIAQQQAVEARDRQSAKEARILVGNSTRTIRFGTAAHPNAKLSEFELKLVDGVMAKRSSQELGGEHHLSARTIEWHLSRIYRRLHVSNRSELRRVVSAWRETA